MSRGFDMQDDLVCEGIIGDGCGGGRIFLIEDEKLQAYDPQTDSYMELLEGVKDARKISKSGCIITIDSLEERILFDLSLLSKLPV